MLILTWLHISDIHFGEEHIDEKKIVLGKLLDDIVSCRTKYNLRPDVIFLTGDLAWSGKRSQYDDVAKGFLDRC